MRRKTLISSIAVAASLSLGAIASPFVLNTANAQTTPPTTTPAPSQSSSRASLRSAFLDQLATALNIQRSQLDSALSTASTSTIDAAVADGTLTQAQADALKARIAAGDLDALFSGHAGRGGRGNGSSGAVGDRATSVAVRQAALSAAATTLNITSEELTTKLRNGETLAQIAQASGTTEQAVTSAALAAAKTQLDQAVTAGTITQAQADAAYTQLQQKGAQLFRSGGRGPRGRSGSQSAPTTPTTPAAETSSL